MRHRDRNAPTLLSRPVDHVATSDVLTHRGRKETAARIAQDYESDPPSCNNCLHRAKALMQADRVTMSEILVCAIGKFRIKPGGICSKWQGLDGSALG